MNASQARWGRPVESLAAKLYYLELGSPDPAGMASFYERALGYRLRERSGSIVATAPQRCLIFAKGRPKTLLRAGYAVPDASELGRLCARIAAAGGTYNEISTTFFSPAIEIEDPDGNRYVFGVADGQTDWSEQEASLSARIQHVVIASVNPASIVRFFIDALGFTLSDDVIDDEGGLRTSFLRSSDEHHSFAVFKASENRFDHHCYETVDWNMIRDWCDHMGSQRIPVQWGPGRHGPGNNLFMFLHDPDGNWVEISAELEIIGPGRPAGTWPHEQHTLNSWGQGFLRS